MLFKNKDVYLLDDILSAVDENIGEHIFKCCVQGLLRDKTVILVTHHVQFTKFSDWLVIMKDGKIEKQGKQFKFGEIFFRLITYYLVRVEYPAITQARPLYLKKSSIFYM